MPDDSRHSLPDLLAAPQLQPQGESPALPETSTAPQLQRSLLSLPEPLSAEQTMEPAERPAEPFAAEQAKGLPQRQASPSTERPSQGPPQPLEGLSTAELARRLGGLSPNAIRVHLCRRGSYYGIRPRRLPNGRLWWPADSIERLLAAGENRADSDLPGAN